MVRSYRDKHFLNTSIVGLGAGDNRGSIWWRLLSPLSYLQKAYGINTIVSTTDVFQINDIPNESVVICSNVLGYTADFYAFVDLLHEKNCLVVYDIDDDYVSKDVAKDFLFDAGLKTPPPHIDLVRQCIRKCDGVTTSTAYLKMLMEPITDGPVIVVPNYIDDSWYKPKVKNPFQSSVLTIGWAGSHRPKYELATMAKAWERIHLKYPQVQFMVIGWKPTILVDAVGEDNLVYVPWADINEYIDTISNIDIACLPMTYAPFNRSKSIVKALEFGSVGVPIIASPTIYGGLINHGGNGYIASSEKEWVYYLSRLIENPHESMRLARKLNNQIAQNYLLSTHAQSRLEVYSAIWEMSRN